MEYIIAWTYGGGMYNDQSNPTVTDCSFTFNKVKYGGGMYNKASHPLVTNCDFYAVGLPYNNSVYGGGMYNEESNSIVIGCSFTGGVDLSRGCGMYNDKCQPTVTDCLFHNMWFCSEGAGMYNLDSEPVVTRCTFFENGCVEYPYGGSGGGIFNQRSDAVITSCLFIDNWADLQGGGIFSYESEAKVTDCIFLENTASFGSGLADNSGASTITNSIFFGNEAYHSTLSAWGGGMASYKSTTTATNCTVIQNSAGDEGGGIWGDGFLMKNCIVWNNTAPVGLEIQGSPSVTYSDIEGGYPGTGNIDLDPLFVDLANGDCHLTFLSPCKDAGTNVGVTESADFEGDLRIAYGTVDMGADEFHTHFYITGDESPGGAIQGKFVGLPSTTPVGLFVGTNALTSPISTMWGAFWLDLGSPWALFYPLGAIPSNGVMVLPSTLPATPAAPYDVPMQALIGLNPDSLTNLEVLEVR
jgi:hypothetical protein